MNLLAVDTQTIYQLQSITIGYWEWLIVGVLFLFLTLIVQRKKIMNIEKQPEYRFYVWGFYAKFFASVSFVVVFYYIYNGGDTYGYFSSAISMANLFYKNPEGYFYVLFHSNTPEALSHFDFFTGYPWGYLIDDSRTFLVIKLISPLAIITYKSFLVSTVILGYLTYKGSWKLFQLFHRYYPQLDFKLAIATLFMPSMLFYGSGILKDSFTFMATCMLTFYFHEIFILRLKLSKNYFYLIFYFLLILGIKPYIIMILLPGLLFWIGFLRYKKIKNRALRVVMVPLIIISILGFTIAFLVSLGSTMDKYAIDKALDTASNAQKDLKSDYYEGASFDIGNFDGTPLGAAKLFPAATFAGLYRPFITEANSPLVLLSALENLFLLYLTLRLFFRASLKRIFKVISGEPLLIFCIIFSILFAFMLGITTSNYGALTRFKIPVIPFLTAGLFIINFYLKKIHFEKMMESKKIRTLKPIS